MTEQEILERQERSGQCEFCLLLVGSFLRAYGHGAFALSRATGYRVVRKERKGGVVYACGFPASQLGLVSERLQAAGGELEQEGEGLWLFRGLDGTPDEAMVSEPKQAKQQPAAAPTVPLAVAAAVRQMPTADWLLEAVMGFNLSMSTPVDAMVFLGSLQQEIRRRGGSVQQ